MYFVIFMDFFPLSLYFMYEAHMDFIKIVQVYYLKQGQWHIEKGAVSIREKNF